MPPQEKNKLSKTINYYRNKIITDKVILSLVLVLCIFAGLVIISLFSPISKTELIKGIHIGTFGVLFDALILVLLFNWINSKGEKNLRITRYQEELYDLKEWQSDQSKFRIRGIIRRLNDEGISDIDLNFIDLSGSTNRMSKINFERINLQNAKLVESNFSHLKMNKSNFNGNKRLHYTKFWNCELHESKFIGCHIQGVNFIDSYLFSANFTRATICQGTDFSGADIRNSNFSEAKLSSTNFENAIVTDDFMVHVSKWGKDVSNVFNKYKVITQPYESGSIHYLKRL